MADTYLVYDFGTDNEAAQRARHRIEGWKQGFRLGDKLTMKFESVEAEEKPGSKTQKHGKKHAKEKAKAEAAESEPASLRLLVRLRFSSHEKLSQERWVTRIPTEEPFKSAAGEVVQSGTDRFQQVAELFDSIRQSEPARS